MLRVSGIGTLAIVAYGGSEEIELGPGEKFTVDIGHLVTFTQDIGLDVFRVGGWKSIMFSGEGLAVTSRTGQADTSNEKPRRILGMADSTVALPERQQAYRTHRWPS